MKSLTKVVVLSSLSSLILMAACQHHSSDNTSETADTALSSNDVQSPSLITYQVLDTFSHSTNAYTEGLIYSKGYLIESTGLEGKSSIRIIDTLSGKTVRQYSNYPDSIFGEGITLLHNKLYQLTYKNHLAFVFHPENPGLAEKTFSWPKEGWGSTNDGTHLIADDGSSQLFYIDPETFHIVRTLDVADDRGPVDQLNELEYIRGYIFANRWHSNQIYKIDPSNGHVLGIIHLDGLLARYKPDFVPGEEDVLNGIAWDDEHAHLYITGKNWPIYFKLSIQ